MKKCYRFFGGFITSQEKWLNKMAAQGYRLVRAGKMTYEFEECTPDSKEYRIEFVGEKSKVHAEEYRSFLEEMGYKVFFKNINLSFAIGKVVVRPWAESGGRAATNSTTFNRELLIIEKDKNGEPFELHTTLEDIVSYYRTLRIPWIYSCIVFGMMTGIMNSWVFAVFAIASLIPCAVYYRMIKKAEREAVIKEE